MVPVDRADLRPISVPEAPAGSAGQAVPAVLRPILAPMAHRPDSKGANRLERPAGSIAVAAGNVVPAVARIPAEVIAEDAAEAPVAAARVEVVRVAA